MRKALVISLGLASLGALRDELPYDVDATFDEIAAGMGVVRGDVALLRP